MNFMNIRRILPVYILTGGCLAFILRFAQNRNGFEKNTGLPVLGSVFMPALIILLTVFAVGLIIFSFRISTRTAVDGNTNGNANKNFFPFDSADSRTAYMISAAGGCFIALAGVTDFMESAGIFPSGGSAMRLLNEIGLGAGTLLPISGALTFFAGIALIFAAISCKNAYKNANQEQENINNKNNNIRRELILIPPVAMVTRLVAAYRLDSINPVMERYAIELLALTALSLACYSLSGLAFGSGRVRNFIIYAGASVILCLCALADGPVWLSSPPLYLGGALVFTGFLMMDLITPPSRV